MTILNYLKNYSQCLVKQYFNQSFTMTDSHFIPSQIQNVNFFMSPSTNISFLSSTTIKISKPSVFSFQHPQIQPTQDYTVFVINFQIQQNNYLHRFYIELALIYLKMTQSIQRIYCVQVIQKYYSILQQELMHLRALYSWGVQH